MKLTLLAAALAMAMCVVAPADARADKARRAAAFAGAWQGTYYLEGQPTAFALTVARDGRCAGVITETIDGGLKRANFTCTLTYQNGAGLLRLWKTYDGTGGWSHQVDYFGAIAPDGRFVAGHWAIGGIGELFHMRRTEGYVS